MRRGRPGAKRTDTLFPHTTLVRSAGIVGVDGGVEAGVEHRPQGMVGDGADDAEPDVRERADGEAHPFGREARDERGVFEAAVAMVDAVDLQHVERFADVFGRAFLACVRDEFEPEAAGAREDAREFRRRMTDFGRIEPDAGDAVEPWQRFVERRFGLFFAQMAEEAEDELRRDAVAFARVVERSEEHTSELQSLMRISYAVFCLQKKT